MDYPAPLSEAQNYLCMPIINTTQASSTPEAATILPLSPTHDGLHFLTFQNTCTELRTFKLSITKYFPTINVLWSIISLKKTSGFVDFETCSILQAMTQFISLNTYSDSWLESLSCKTYLLQNCTIFMPWIQYAVDPQFMLFTFYEVTPKCCKFTLYM